MAVKVTFDGNCILVGIDGTRYQICVEDISNTGAVVRLLERVRSNSLDAGEMCGLMLRQNHNVPFRKHTGTIMSLNRAGRLEVSFSQQEVHLTKKKKLSSQSLRDELLDDHEDDDKNELY